MQGVAVFVCHISWDIDTGQTGQADYDEVTIQLFWGCFDVVFVVVDIVVVVLIFEAGSTDLSKVLKDGTTIVM